MKTHIIRFVNTLRFFFRTWFGVLKSYLPAERRKREALRSQGDMIQEQGKKALVVSTIGAYRERVKLIEIQEEFRLRQQYAAPPKAALAQQEANARQREAEMKAWLREHSQPLDEMWERELERAGVKSREEYHKLGSPGRRDPVDGIVLTDEEVQHLISGESEVSGGRTLN